MTPTPIATRDPLRTTFELSTHVEQDDPPMWPLIPVLLLVGFVYHCLPPLGFHLAMGAVLFVLAIAVIVSLAFFAGMAFGDLVQRLSKLKLVAADILNPGT